jgi:hypothetical protein
VLTPLVLVPLANGLTPDLFGVPLFYWAQFALVGASMVFVVAVLVLTGRG